MWKFFGPALAFIAVPLVKKVLLALGIGIISYTGIQVAFDQVRNLIVSNYGLMSSEVAQLVDLAGVGQAIGIVLGALAARIALIALSHFGRVL